jgi:hypothetical protein
MVWTNRINGQDKKTELEMFNRSQYSGYYHYCYTTLTLQRYETSDNFQILTNTHGIAAYYELLKFENKR